MKKLLLTLTLIVTLLIFIPCYSSVNKPRTRKEFEQKIKLQKTKIQELENAVEALKSIIKVKDAEIVKLKHELSAERRTASGSEDIAGSVPEKPSKNASSAGILKNPIFGIYLGESFNSLKKRKKINPSAYAYTNKDCPGSIWNVENTDANIKTLLISTYQEKIYEITIYLADASQANYDVIKKQLQEKYAGVDDEGLVETLFSDIKIRSVVDGTELMISLNYDNNFGLDDDEMILRYIHSPIWEKVQAEMKHRKAAKISSEL